MGRKYTPKQRVEAQLLRQQELAMSRYYDALAREERSRRKQAQQTESK